MSKALTTRQQLQAQQKVAAAYPLFAEVLAPELPQLKAHVAEHGSKDLAPAARFEVGQRVSYLLDTWKGKVYKATITSRSPAWAYDGRFYYWYYYLAYDEGEIQPAFSFLHKLPGREDRLTKEVVGLPKQEQEVANG